MISSNPSSLSLLPTPIDETKMNVVDQIPLMESLAALNGCMMSLFSSDPKGLLQEQRAETTTPKPFQPDYAEGYSRPPTTYQKSPVSVLDVNVLPPDLLASASNCFPQNDTRSKSAGASNKPTQFQGGQNELWERRYKELEKFREEHGHTLVPLSCTERRPQLAHWSKYSTA